MAGVSEIVTFHLDRFEGGPGAAPDFRTWVDAAEVADRFERLEREHGPLIALAVAQIPRAAHHSPLQAVARTASTIGEALEGTLALWPTLTDLFQWRTERVGRNTVMFATETATRPGLQRLTEFLVADMIRTARRASAWAWVPVEITFVHAGDAAAWSTDLGCPVRFQASRTTLVFAPEHLEIPLASADPVVSRTMLTLARDATPQQAITMREKTRSAIRAQLEAGTPPTLASSAKRMGRSERSLHRDLAAEDSRFRDELDAVRAELAALWADVPADELAARLGYGSVRALRRARQRWAESDSG